MPPFVVTVTPNGSVDTVLRATAPLRREELDVELVAETAGGKGHNVARFLAAAGVRTLACGFTGGWPGDELGALLVSAGVEPHLTPIRGATRRYTTLLRSGHRRVSYHRPGPSVTADEAARFVRDVVAASAGAAHVVLAGSLPPGTPTDLYAELARRIGPSRVWLDSSGSALGAAILAQPAHVKVNSEELVALGVRLPVRPHQETWHRILRDLAAKTGVDEWWVTLGRGGAVACIGDRWLAVTAPPVKSVNTTGAGDAFLAALIHARLEGRTDGEAAVAAVALAAAVVEQDAPLPPDPNRVVALRADVSLT